MKSNYFFLVFTSCTFFITGEMNGQMTIAQWNFNTPTNYSTPEPSTGSGSALLIGGTTGASKSGSATDPLYSSNPPKQDPNQAWQTTSYAPSGLSNKQCGVQFNISTVGYQGIVFKFDQRLSQSANTTYEVQYTSNRTASYPVWNDFKMFTVTPSATAGDAWYNGRTVDLSNVTELNNNPNVAIRIVSMFDPTKNDYLCTSTNNTTTGTIYTYGTSGTVRFDMVTFAGTKILGVNDFTDNNKFFFYPNPTKGDMIYFNDNVTVHIFDILGKEILNANDVLELNIGNFTPGVYFIKDEEGYTTKLIKS